MRRRDNISFSWSMVLVSSVYYDHCRLFSTYIILSSQSVSGYTTSMEFVVWALAMRVSSLRLVSLSALLMQLQHKRSLSLWLPIHRTWSDRRVSGEPRSPIFENGCNVKVRYSRLRRAVLCSCGRVATGARWCCWILKISNKTASVAAARRRVK